MHTVMSDNGQIQNLRAYDNAMRQLQQLMGDIIFAFCPRHPLYEEADNLM